MLSKTNVQYEIFYLNLTKRVWRWYGGETKPKSLVSLVPDPSSPCIGSIPHLINQLTINKQRDNLWHGTLDHAMVL